MKHNVYRNPLVDAASHVLGAEQDGLRFGLDGVLATIASRLERLPFDPIGGYVRLEQGALGLGEVAARGVATIVQRLRNR